jgi:PKHD-type hydroxylase
VTRGERLACFFWVESMVRSDEQRRLLYDLDMACCACASATANPRDRGLTGTYHNLLRMWADT